MSKGLHVTFRKLAFGLLFVVMSQAHAQPTAIQVVAKLYRDFAWEAVIDEPRSASHTLLSQPRAVLELYFDAKLSSLIFEDRQCVTQTREICKLDFSPIWASQDPGATELKIVSGSKPNIVSVKFRHPGNGETIELSYFMARTKLGWRVSDIRYTSGSTLLSVLSAKP